MTEAVMASTSDELEQPRRCPGVKPDGSPCRVPAQMLLPSGWCLLHDPDKATERSSNATAGGNKTAKRMRKGLDPEELGRLETAADAQRITALLTLALASGELPAPAGRAALVAITAWLRAHDLNELEQRLDELERAARERR